MRRIFTCNMELQLGFSIANQSPTQQNSTTYIVNKIGTVRTMAFYGLRNFWQASVEQTAVFARKDHP